MKNEIRWKGWLGVGWGEGGWEYAGSLHGTDRGSSNSHLHGRFNVKCFNGTCLQQCDTSCLDHSAKFSLLIKRYVCMQASVSTSQSVRTDRTFANRCRKHLGENLIK